ncbi:hypothetical protein MKK69_06610 [Methylobacterium sp. J-026]|uniref:hypothetical protein n=1 Tax=Methylobacterium sp. J-026 TaxID=2836624 RepID=UPI001FB8EBDE|nr:hypothetical protein [Methylobacterium sp. J-026]MCJ2133744.1 hypothetical protein [Methylobacterium sp. J-026]
MPATPEFIRFSERFNQSIDDQDASFEEATAAILGCFKGEDRAACTISKARCWRAT